MNKYGLVVAYDFCDEATVIMAKIEDNPQDFKGTHFYKCSDVDKLEEQLLNAFQLVKNGKCKSYLKFEDFKKLMLKKHDHNGDIVK